MRDGLTYLPPGWRYDGTASFSSPRFTTRPGTGAQPTGPTQPARPAGACTKHRARHREHYAGNRARADSRRTIAAPARSWLAYACIVVAAIVPLALSPIGPVPHWAIIQDRIAPLVWWFAMVTIGSVRAVDARADSPIHDNQLNAICSAALMLATLWLGFSWPADTAASWVAAALVWAACLFVVIGTRRTVRIWPALVLLIPAALPQLLGDLSLSAALVVAGLGLIWSAQHLARHPGSRLPAPRMQKLAPLVLSVVVLIAAVRWSWL